MTARHPLMTAQQAAAKHPHRLDHALRLLIVTAVEAEAAAIRAADVAAVRPGKASAGRVAEVSVQVAPTGAGPAAAAAVTGRLLALAEAAGKPFHAVINAGIAGGFPGRAPVGATVLGARSIAADLGAETPDGFLPIDELGFGTSGIEADQDLLAGLSAALPWAVVGDIVTLSTVTGSAPTAARLSTRFPGAVAEAMEGYGVGCAAAAADVPFIELRTISNPLGPRDRAAWRIPEALTALTEAATAVLTALHGLAQP